MRAATRQHSRSASAATAQRIHSTAQPERSAATSQRIQSKAPRQAPATAKHLNAQHQGTPTGPLAHAATLQAGPDYNTGARRRNCKLSCVGGGLRPVVTHPFSIIKAKVAAGLNGRKNYQNVYVFTWETR